MTSEIIAGAVAIIGGAVLIFSRLGLITFGKNGNGKFSLSACNERHGTVNLKLQRLEDRSQDHENRLAKGDERFDKIIDQLASINTHIAVIAASHDKNNPGN